MKITQPSGQRRARAGGAPQRLAGSLAVGALAAGGLVAWDDLHDHAALVAVAARQPHETVGSILATGGVVTFLLVTAIVFLAVTVAARRRSARSAASPYPPAAPRRRSRAPARW